jgi:hypothetical protein
MPIPKEAGTLAMPWEQSYGYAQAVRVGANVEIGGALNRDPERRLAIEGGSPVGEALHFADLVLLLRCESHAASERSTSAPTEIFSARLTGFFPIASPPRGSSVQARRVA